MRSVCLPTLLFLVSFTIQTKLAAPQETPKKPVPRKVDTASHGKPLAPPKFDILSHEEASSWANVLDRDFDSFQITAETQSKAASKTKDPSSKKNPAKDVAKKQPAEGPATAKTQKRPEKSPTGRLCITARGEKAPEKCPDVPAELVDTQDFSDLQSLIGLLDTKNFKGVEADDSYIVRMKGSEQVSAAIAAFFTHPAPGLNLRSAGKNFLVLIPRLEAKGMQANTAGLIKQDLERLNEAFLLSAKSKERPSNDGACPSNPNADDCAKAVVAMEKWLSQYTVSLSYLSARDVTLALSGVDDSFQVRQIGSGGSTVTILPAKGAETNGAYLAADAIERDELARTRSKQSGADSARNVGDAKDSTASGSSSNQKSLDTGKSGGAPSSKDAASGDKTADSAEAVDPPDSDSPSTDSSDANGAAGAKQGDKGPAPAGKPLELDKVVRLFHLRNAKDIAATVNKASSNGDVLAALDNNPQNDLLMILPAAGEHATDIKRAIAMLDLPRPQLSLQVWHYQLSTKSKLSERPVWALFGGGADAGRLQAGYDEFRKTVLEANSRMTAALERGYAAALNYAVERKNGPSGSLFNPVFHDYLTGKYQDCLKADHYCLGFYDALDIGDSPDSREEKVIGASLTRLLVLIAASSDEEASNLVGRVTDEMTEGPDCAAVPDENQLCLEFTHFQEQLSRLAQLRNLHELQAALLDFLFQYKWTVVYPNDFVPYDLQRTAHTLDDLLQPVVEAFNQDLDGYVESLFRERFRGERILNGLLNRGQIQVSALSGSQASVTGKVINYFDITPPMSLNDILNTGNQGNVATALKSVLQPKEVTILQALANIGAQPRITAELSENATLKITPISLNTASSAELDVDLDVGEPTAPATSGVSSPPKDLLDRVSDHHVTTHVRVESLKLFELSSFTMTLTHPQRGFLIPVVGWGWEAVFGTIPYVGNLFRLPPYSSTVDSRSLAVVRATVVPTAMDLALGLRFEGDRILDPVSGTMNPLSSVHQAGGRMRPFHKSLIEQFRLGIEDWSVGPRLSNSREDLRRSTTN